MKRFAKGTPEAKAHMAKLRAMRNYKKTLWNTIQIGVPAEMVDITKNGKVSVKKTLTKTSNISRSHKQPAIKLVPTNDGNVKVINTGKEWDIEELKKRTAKAKALEKKNKDKNIFEPQIKRYINLNKFEDNIAKRARELVSMKKKASIIKFNDVIDSDTLKENSRFKNVGWNNKAWLASTGDDAYKNIKYYWTNAYKYMDSQEEPTNEELKSVSYLLHKITPKYGKIHSWISASSSKSAGEMIWSVLNSITDEQYRIIMKIAYHDGKNKNNKFLYKSANMYKKQLEDEEKKRIEERNKREEQLKNRTPEEKAKQKAFIEKLQQDEIRSNFSRKEPTIFI